DADHITRFDGGLDLVAGALCIVRGRVEARNRKGLGEDGLPCFLDEEVANQDDPVAEVQPASCLRAAVAPVHGLPVVGIGGIDAGKVDTTYEKIAPDGEDIGNGYHAVRVRVPAKEGLSLDASLGRHSAKT